MSQEQPSQPPTSPKSGAKQPRTTVTQTTGNQVQSLLKSLSIKTLRGTIHLLEGALVKLEAPATATLPPGKGTRQPIWSQIQSIWGAVLRTIRALLPASLNQKLSNTALTGIITGVAFILVWTTSALSPSKPTQVAAVPPTEPVPPAIVTPSEQVPSPIATPPEQVPPAIATSPAEKLPPDAIATPPELTAPAPAEPVEVKPSPVTPVPKTPTIELTPEQNLIASIQNEVAEITNKYADGLIQSIQANFPSSRLTVKVSDNWYTLDRSQQDKLASEMLGQSKELDFSHLEVTDSQGKLLARSPVVGTEMIVLKRQA